MTLLGKGLGKAECASLCWKKGFQIYTLVIPSTGLITVVKLSYSEVSKNN